MRPLRRSVCARLVLERVFKGGLNIWGRATFVPKTKNAQRRHLKIGGLNAFLCFVSLRVLQRNEVPPRTGANSNKQENPT